MTKVSPEVNHQENTIPGAVGDLGAPKKIENKKQAQDNQEYEQCDMVLGPRSLDRSKGNFPKRENNILLYLSPTLKIYFLKMTL